MGSKLPAVRCENRTGDGWVGSANATSVLCRPHLKTPTTQKNLLDKQKWPLMLLGRKRGQTNKYCIAESYQ